MPFLRNWLINGERSGNIQSIILGAILVMASVQVFAMAFVADLIASHRLVTQRVNERVRRIELHLGVAPSHYLAPEAGASASEATDSVGSSVDVGATS